MNPSSDVFGWAILVATFVGPVVAVLVTRWVDGRRERHDRRLNIFRTLMANRASVTNAEFIKALNLIEIDFHGEVRVLNAWKDYFKNLGESFAIDDPRIRQLSEKRHRLFVVLLDTIAKSVGIKIEQLSILDGGYYPDGAVRVEAEQAAIRELFAGIAEGRRVLPIMVVNPPGEASNP